ncbi:hypothetical protein Barb4_00579 [Bacteroidales bacterium Barb4]|nr:hypothetical protein Barb4_00579 [Bacteroidales bacterium Barb4]
MKTKKQNVSSQASPEGEQQEANVSQPKKYNKVGEWFHDPNSKPLITIVNMRAVLK